MIKTDQLCKSYTKEGGVTVHALRSVSLNVAKGEFVAVRGPSGCGKSTLLMLCGGLAMPSEGDVAIGGESLPAVSAAGRARFRGEQIGFVGSTGNASDWLPHLHFQYAPKGSDWINPYPLVKELCG